MATTTPNYAWVVPTSSDLVKNGATAIETLGDSVDASLWSSGDGQAGKNKIINGNMLIAQRSTSVAGITTDATYNTVDRFQTRCVTLGTWTQSQESDGPAGFAKSLKMLCTVADAAPAAADRLAIVQKIEGNNVQNFAYGTSSAKTITVSFWVKSNVTGTFIAELFNVAGTPRQLSRSYTISVANTWEKKSFVILGDTTTAITADNAERFSLILWLGAGSNFTSGTLQTVWANEVSANRAVGQTNLAAAINNYWQLTGVQIEIGDYPTNFQTASGGSYPAELAMCQRYYYRFVPLAGSGGNYYGPFAVGGATSTTNAYVTGHLPVALRSAPTINRSGGQIYNLVTNTAASGLGNAWATGTSFSINVTVASGLVLNQVCHYAANNSATDYLDFSSEL